MPLVACFLALITTAQNIETINLQNRLIEKEDVFTNGYSKKISGEDISYTNLWSGDEKAFLTRATTGQMEIAWQSEPVKSVRNGSATFLLLVCLDQANTSRNFNFYINDQNTGFFPNFHTTEFKKELQPGVIVNFSRVGITSWGDGTFFMEVTVPQHLAEINKPVLFKVVGEKAQSNAWFMVFKTNDLVKELKHHVLNDESFALSKKGAQIVFYAPDVFEKKLFNVKVNDKNTYNATLKMMGGRMGFEINNKDTVSSVSIFCEGKELMNIQDFNSFKDSNYLKGDKLFKQQRDENGLYLFSNQYSNAYDLLKELSKSQLNNAKINVMVSSHQDIAWMDTPYRCIEARDDVIVSPALELLEQHADYRYDIEDALILEEYLERNPQKRGLINRLLKNGQLGIGAAYTQPYEEMQTGEALVRQFYYGKRFLTKNFDGYETKTYWNVDVPGRTLQMPQILKKSGVQGIQYSRHERGLYRWVAPDSSSVMVFTPGHYSAAAQFLLKTPEEGVEKFNDYVKSFPEYRNNKSAPAVIGMLSAEDMSQAHTYYHWINKFKEFSKTIQSPLPEIKHSTSDMFFNDLSESNPTLPSIVGERPNLWLYIHGPAHERAITTYREANKKAIFAETFSTIACLLKGSFSEYPKRYLDQMWKDIIYADHGWGGKGGNVTDSLFYARYRRADTVAAEISRSASNYIAGKINFNRKNGTPLVVFNPLSISYSTPVKVAINTKKNPIYNLSIYNVKGEKIGYQLNNIKGDEAEIEFIAENLPSVGYSTYYASNKPTKPNSGNTDPAQSQFYSLVFKDGKLLQVVDKELGRELFDTSKFEVGEIFTMQSVGNGAGEFASIQIPTMENFDKTSNYDNVWKLISNGDVYSLYRCETTFKDATIVRNLKLYKTIKQIDFTSSILNFNGNHYREFRQAFPMKKKGEMSYEVPFGTVLVGKDEMKGHAGERYMDEAQDIHPRGIANWMGYSDGSMDVKLTSGVAVVDYIDPTESPVSNNIIQPILFASRRSCHWLGEFYAQEGDHHFEFSLRSDKFSSPDSRILAKAANYKPMVVYDPENYRDAPLPETLSFFSINNKNISISTLKKSEDEEQIIMRVYDAAAGYDYTSTKLKSFFPIQKIYHTDMLEFNPKLQQSNENLPIGNKAIETFKLVVNGR